MNSTITAFEGEFGEDRPRKRSVPPVHIPLLDFSKLNQPRPSVIKKNQETQSKKEPIYKPQNKPYTTLEPRPKSALHMTSTEGSQHSWHAKHSFGEKPVDLANQKHAAAEQTKYRIDLQDVQRLPKKTVSKED